MNKILLRSTADERIVVFESADKNMWTTEDPEYKFSYNEYAEKVQAAYMIDFHPFTRRIRLIEANSNSITFTPECILSFDDNGPINCHVFSMLFDFTKEQSVHSVVSDDGTIITPNPPDSYLCCIWYDTESDSWHACYKFSDFNVSTIILKNRKQYHFNDYDQDPLTDKVLNIGVLL